MKPPFNLSRWALENIPLIRYLMAALLIGGILSFSKLGQDEDPPFTFRIMVVRTFWPGATAQQMAEQPHVEVDPRFLSGAADSSEIPG